MGNYVDAKKIDGMLHVVIADGDERTVELYEPEYVMYFPDDCGRYKSIFGEKLAKFTTGSYFELLDAIEIVNEAGLQTFESEVAPRKIPKRRWT